MSPHDRSGKSGVLLVVGLLLVGIGLAVFAKLHRAPSAPALPPASPAAAPSSAAPAPSPAAPAGPPAVTAVLKGRVLFMGDPPEPKQLPVTKDNEACECDPKTEERRAYKLDESLVVDAGTKGIANAVVWVKGVKGGPPRPAAMVDQQGCQFVPHVALLTPGGRITLLNPDGIAHNYHWWATRNPAGNVTVPKFKKTMDLPEEGFAAPEFIRVTCDVHAWMGMWVAVVEGGFAAVTDAKGSFSIPGLPVGTHTIGLWHESLAPEPMERTVTLGPEGGQFEVTLP